MSPKKLPHPQMNLPHPQASTAALDARASAPRSGARDWRRGLYLPTVHAVRIATLIGARKRWRMPK